MKAGALWQEVSCNNGVWHHAHNPLIRERDKKFWENGFKLIVIVDADYDCFMLPPSKRDNRSSLKQATSQSTPMCHAGPNGCDKTVYQRIVYKLHVLWSLITKGSAAYCTHDL